MNHGYCDVRNSIPFEYPPLGTDDIRIITILPGSGDICCRMGVHSLENNSPDFAALSYHWGSSAPEQEKQAIWVGGRPFSVSTNLLDAMQALRHPFKERKLWVDAVCINQAVNADKEQQLPLMSRIYNEAQGVIVWLGPCADDSDFVMDVIEHGDVERMNSDRFVVGIAKLWQRSWFSRTWVVQEYVLGRPRIFCGRRSVSAAKFYATRWLLAELLVTKRHDAMRTREQINLDLSAGGGPASMYSEVVVSDAAIGELKLNTSLPQISDLRQMVLDHDGNLRSRNLALVLRQYRTLDATNPKDKVYGTLGLVEKSVFQHILIDYRDSTSVGDVYSSAMAYIIGVKRDIEAIDLFALLPMPLSTQQPMPRLPSWVPDFSSKAPPLIDVGVLTWYIRYHTSSALRGKKLVLQRQHGRHILYRDPIEASVQGHRLITQGFIVDEIQDLVSSAFFSSRDAMREHVESCAKDSNTSPGGLSPDSWRFLRSLYERFGDIAASEDFSNIFDNDETPLYTVLALKLTSILRYVTLIQVDKICRKKFTELNISVKADEWITSIWSDLLEGFPSLRKGGFRAEFNDMAGSPVPVEMGEWLERQKASESLANRNFKEETYPLHVAIQSLFSDGRKFFVAKSTGLYGIGMPTIREGDKIAFLFPPIYMACVLRPLGDHYQLIAPAIVPLILRTKYIWQHVSSGRAPQRITIV